MPVPFVIGATLPQQQTQAGGLGARAGQQYDPTIQPGGGQGFRLGSNRVLNIPANKDGNVSVGYLEISGPGLGSIHKTLEMKEKQLIAVGARLIADQSRSQAETAQTARIRSQADASLLRLAANVVDQLLTRGLMTMAEWMGVDGTVSVQLNRAALDEPQEEGTRDRMDVDSWPLE